ncbi:DUF805 domain-containing protein [Acinetobacter sp. ANC 4173]|uniref:DUF805 domain-containing protein n=1 Tax=Acinetobacter sp. ANC 4173 TaxID=2529837 RepID=UPI001040924E|nr:DUF805 domain-containing protein [Acinetobacter sp. ANC 4173]TCB81096.1 DUF805 domain-containing protein [Acinetobacter sp. ANC 4173]
MNPAVNDSALSTTGRFGRLSYFGWNGLLLIAVMILVLLCILLLPGFSPAAGQSMSFFTLLIFGMIYIGMLYFTFVFTIRRLHDRNHSGWLSLVMLVPIANIIMMLYLSLAKGDVHENQFGQPRPTHTWEKLLGWIYILIFPIGFFLAIAIPAYQDYVQRAQQQQIEMQQQAE